MKATKPSPSASLRGIRKPSAAPVTGSKSDTIFGAAAHTAWTLRESGLSLVRHAVRPKPVRLDAQPLGIEIDLMRCALVVIDMQNDFCHPLGWLGQQGMSVKPMRKPIPLIARLLPAWRAGGARVVWLNWGVRPDRLNLSPLVQFKGKRSAAGVGYAERSPLDRGLSVVPGEWGAQVVDELTVVPEDITIFKHRLSGFWDNEFDSVLRQQGITTLLFAGVNTDRCVFSTLQDAGFLGYDCVLLQDACSTPSPAYVSRAILYMVRQLHGFTASAEALQIALAKLPGQGRRAARRPAEQQAP